MAAVQARAPEDTGGCDGAVHTFSAGKLRQFRGSTVAQVSCMFPRLVTVTAALLMSAALASADQARQRWPDSSGRSSTGGGSQSTGGGSQSNGGGSQGDRGGS